MLDKELTPMTYNVANMFKFLKQIYTNLNKVREAKDIYTNL